MFFILDSKKEFESPCNASLQLLMKSLQDITSCYQAGGGWVWGLWGNITGSISSDGGRRRQAAYK